MKKLLITVLMLVSLNVNSQSMYPTDKVQDIDLHLENVNVTSTTLSSSSYGSNNTGHIGVGMMAGGALFLTAGLLTAPDYDTLPDGTIKTKPFFRQGARMLSIMTGGACLMTGIIITIGK